MGSPTSKGAAESAVREVIGLAQAFYFQMLDTFRLKDGLPEHPIYTWLLRHAALVRNKYHMVNKDGDTPFKIRNGRHYLYVELLEFEEVVMARVPLRAHKGKLRGRFVQATYLGKTEPSGEFIVSDMSGHGSTMRTIRRLTAPERHNPLGIENVQKQPWQIKSQAAYPDREVTFDLRPDRERELDAGAGLPVPPPGRARQHETPRPRPDVGFGMAMPEPIGARSGMLTPPWTAAHADRATTDVPPTDGRHTAPTTPGATVRTPPTSPGQGTTGRDVTMDDSSSTATSSSSPVACVSNDPPRQDQEEDEPTWRSGTSSRASWAASCQGQGGVTRHRA